MTAAQVTLLLLVYTCLFIASSAKQPYCPSSSSCGIIPNISYPFRLKGDPSHSGFRKNELVCESNVSFLYFNYTDYTIRLLDASINISDVCSFPTYSESYSDPALLSIYRGDHEFTLPINLMSCPQPLNTCIPLSCIDTSHCQSSSSRFSYVRIGRMKASEVPETCRVDVIVMTPWEIENLNNVSLQEIHQSLLYGFRYQFCQECATPWTLWDRIKSFISGVGDKIKSFISGTTVFLLIPLVIIVIISAGGSLALMIIGGFTCVLILLFVPFDGIYMLGYLFHYRGWWGDYVFNRTYSVTGALSSVISVITICIPRFFICPLIVWLLILQIPKKAFVHV